MNKPAFLDIPAVPGDGRLLITRDVPAVPDHLWHCLRQSECLKAWWLETAESDARLAGRFVEPSTGPEGRVRTARAQVTAFQPPLSLVRVWADGKWTFDTVVSICIEKHGESSRVSVEHQRWKAAADESRDALLSHHHAGWTGHLANWAHHAEYSHDRREGH